MTLLIGSFAAALALVLALVLTLGLAVHAVLLRRRLDRLDRSLFDLTEQLAADRAAAEAAAASRIDPRTPDGRLAAALRIGAELAAANREATTPLQRFIQRSQRHRPAIERELTEPKGFAERAGLVPLVDADPPATAGIEPASEPELAEPKGFAERIGLPPVQVEGGAA